MTAKVFVGNLVFSTTGDQLKNAFSPSAPVLSANIITRGRRSLGYGFVEFASEADAEKAVAAMNKKEIDGRAINVELARPRDPAKEAEVREKREARAARPRAPRAPKAEGETVEGAAANGEAQPRRRPGRRPRKGPRAGRRAAADGATAATATANGTTAAADGAAAPAAAAPAPRTRAPRTRGPSAPRRPPAEPRPISDTTLFVANVPFSTDDAQLLAFFAEHKPKSAHVIRMRNGRSRGYGFVEFDDQTGQKAGLAVDGKEVPLNNGNSLKLSVKVAMTPPPIQAPADAAATTDAAAPAADAAPAATGETPQ